MKPGFLWICVSWLIDYLNDLYEDYVISAYTYNPFLQNILAVTCWLLLKFPSGIRIKVIRTKLFKTWFLFYLKPYFYKIVTI